MTPRAAEILDGLFPHISGRLKYAGMDDAPAAFDLQEVALVAEMLDHELDEEDLFLLEGLEQEWLALIKRHAEEARLAKEAGRDIIAEQAEEDWLVEH